jgi:hypothetical protein
MDNQSVTKTLFSCLSRSRSLPSLLPSSLSPFQSQGAKAGIQLSHAGRKASTQVILLLPSGKGRGRGRGRGRDGRGRKGKEVVVNEKGTVLKEERKVMKEGRKEGRKVAFFLPPPLPWPTFLELPSFLP